MTLKPEHIVEELNRTPKLKRDLIMKMMEVMLDSEAFLEAYPTLYDPCIADVDLEYREVTTITTLTTRLVCAPDFTDTRSHGVAKCERRPM